MKRITLITIGFISFGLGSIGAIIPVLPTTPFLLLAGYCFARSSDRFNEWLINTTIYEFYVSDYAETKSIPRSKKWTILGNIYIIMGFSTIVAPITWVKVLLIGLTIFLTVMLFFVIPDREQ